MAVNELWHDAFYRFIRLETPQAWVEALQQVCVEARVLGSVLLAEEGINGMLSGTASQLEQVRGWLEAQPPFAQMLYKRTPCQTKPFAKLKVKLKREIVPLGLEGVDATAQTGINVGPQAWRELIRQPDVVLIDNRNSFEYDLGHFVGATNPQVSHFRDFAAYVEDQLPEWEGKRIAMYCTGGIRCEKTTAWLAQQGLQVYQLEGGILNYFQRIPDAQADYQGHCFVFDDRELLDTALQEVPKNR